MAGAQAAAEAAVDSLVALALQRAPMLLALARDAEAAAAAAPAAGALPDPMIGLAVRGEDYPGSGIGEDPMAMAALEVDQVIPWPGKRGRREAAALAEVGVARGRQEIARRNLAADVRAGYADLFAAEHERRALQRAVDLVDLLLPAVTARYAAGQAEQTDVIALQLERGRLLDALDQVEGMRAELAAGIAGMLDLAPDHPLLAAHGLPAAGDAMAPGTFAEVLAAQSRLERARSRAAAAAGEGTPDLVVGAEYGWRDGLPPMITARIGVELPLWKGRKQDALARSSLVEVAAAEAELRAAEAKVRGETAALEAQMQAAARRTDRLRTETLPQALMAVEAARADYAAGRADLDRVVMGLRQLAETQAQLARRQADHYVAFARLRAHCGLDPVLLSREE